MSHIEKALAFIRHWEAKDVEAILSALASDVVYHNIPMPVLTGRDAVREFITPFLGGVERVQWEVHQIAETAQGAVLTERSDHFFMQGGANISVRVMGVFEFNSAGEIDKWRDYFDLAEFQAQKTS
ncbi:MAG: limonene-1,2-epoxide hydrolase family protein [Pseudomonadota bacterium]